MNILNKKRGIKLVAQVLVVISILGMGSMYNLVFVGPIRVNAVTTSTITINKLTYAYSGTTASLTDSTANGNIIIPSTITVNGKKYTVTSIGDWAFNNGYAHQVTSVTIPSTVISIGNYAFDNTQITSLIIPNSVKTIGDNCFYNCSKLASVVIPNSVTSIGNSAFTNCSNLTSVTIPSSVTSISPDTFYQCINLRSVTIPSGVTSIGECAFSKCANLTSVTIPSSVKSIGDYAFWNCTGLKSVYFKEQNIQSIYNEQSAEAFSGCSNVTTFGVGNIIYILNNSKLTATTSAKTTNTLIQFDDKFYNVVVSK
ncbi:leucine-rich repeat domain-containing protein [Clostridium sp.]|uniref:leucine-rich repeat domain-containing protein n=1 Tax=Clostridium sp. TaxID=1506 RepID=UPI0026290D95|nr:leucine-rich repeat domain-containing protein [Clostridium sp.]